MGRKSYRHDNLPPRMRKRVRGKHTYYYYDTGGRPRKEIPLGKCFVIALQKYAELELSNHDIPTEPTINQLAIEYELKVVPKKAPKTQRDNRSQMKALLAFFDGAPLTHIKPHHIRQYLDERHRIKDGVKTPAPTSANREIALFSDMFRHANEWGWIFSPNPAKGVRKHTEKPRDKYVTDEEYMAAWEAGCVVVKEFLDTAYLTMQRVSDVLNIQESDIYQDAIEFTQSKTGKRVRVAIDDDFALLVESIRERKRQMPIYNTHLLVNEKGDNVTYSMLKKRFAKAKADADVVFNLQDIRAKAATDREEQTGSEESAKDGLGHQSVNTTRRYIRNRRGKLVEPMKLFRKKESD